VSGKRRIMILFSAPLSNLKLCLPLPRLLSLPQERFWLPFAAMVLVARCPVWIEWSGLFAAIGFQVHAAAAPAGVAAHEPLRWVMGLGSPPSQSSSSVVGASVIQGGSNPCRVLIRLQLGPASLFAVLGCSCCCCWPARGTQPYLAVQAG